MRWAVPADRMSDDQQIDELLVRATEDWLHPADVFDVARFSGATDEVSYVEQAVRLVTDLLRIGLVVAGELTSAGFRPWPDGPLESAERIAARWHAQPDTAPTDFFVWLQATPRGIERGQQALAGRG